MIEFRLADFEKDTITVEYGGESSIDVYTLTQSLAGFADTARAINFLIDPGQEIEILIEATGDGSFKTVLKRVRKESRGLFTGVVHTILWGVVVNVIYDKYVKEEPTAQITINTTEVLIKLGGQQIVVPRTVYNAAENVKKDAEVERCIRRTFEPLQKDPKITGFGLTTSLEAPQLPVYIPRKDFPRLTRISVPPDVSTQTQRTSKVTARLIILKAWLNQAKRKWSFEWNGVPISAPIKDADFLEDIARRKYLIGAGDALDVEVLFTQNYDPKLNVFVTDQASYVISKVLAHVAKQAPVI